MTMAKTTKTNLEFLLVRSMEKVEAEIAP